MKKTCLYCNEDFEDHTKSKCCCHEHQLMYKNRQKFPDDSDFVECKICGFRGHDINQHIKKNHNITINDYCCKFNIDKLDLQSKTIRKHNSNMQKLAYKEGRLHGWGKGDANPSRRKEVKEGRKSIFSKNYVGYDGLSQEEKEQKIQFLFQTLAKNKKKNKTNPLTTDYYLAKGYSEIEAKKMLRKRQATFSLQKCIEKYGVDKGTQMFNERQKKWQNTLNSKPIEEINRINAAKTTSTKFICGYSKISQDLFNKIYDEIKSQYSMIFYATRNNSDRNSNENFEYEVILEDNIHRYFLDFYVKDNNKVIEFDGDYWHGEKRGNQKRDKEREEKLKSLGFVNILHIKEHDYMNNPDKVLQECLEFIRK